MKLDTMFGYLLLSAAVWRVTNMLMYEEGFYDCLHRLRYLVGVRYNAKSEPEATNEFAKLFVCHWCLSFWVAVLFTLGLCFRPDWAFTVALPFAISALSILLHEVHVWHERRTARFLASTTTPDS